jgi:hypothetical protein
LLAELCPARARAHVWTEGKCWRFYPPAAPPRAALLPPRLFAPSLDCGLGQPASCAITSNEPDPRPSPGYFSYSVSLRRSQFSAFSAPLTRGVGHPEKPLSDVRRGDARSAQIGTPDGISETFQVSAYSGEPFTSIFARNLLSKDRCRAALGDEAVKSGPEVSLVGMAFALSRARKRLTGATGGPDFSVIGPIGKTEGVGPSANAGEEMALPKRSKLVGVDFDDAAGINGALRQMPSRNEIAQPLRHIGIAVVVIGRVHSFPRPER